MVYIADNIQLQEITIEDQPQLIALVGAIYPPVYKHLWKNEDCSWYLNKFYSFENLTKELSEKETNYFFVIYNLHPVGIFRVHYNRPLKEDKYNSSAYLHRIYLGEEAQGKGVAKQLFDWAEHQAIQKGKTSMWLKAMDTQQQALRFYEKQGYKKIGTLQLEFDLINKSFGGMFILKKTLAP